MSKEDWQALKELKNDESIVTKEAEEGAVVIMDSDHYEQTIYKQTEDQTTYKKIDPSCDNKIMRANKAIIKKYENPFLKQEIDYLEF